MSSREACVIPANPGFNLVQIEVEEADNRLGCEITLLRFPVVAWEIHRTKKDPNKSYFEFFYSFPITVDSDAHNDYFHDEMQDPEDGKATFWAIEDPRGHFYFQGKIQATDESELRKRVAEEFSVLM